MGKYRFVGFVIVSLATLFTVGLGSAPSQAEDVSGWMSSALDAPAVQASYIDGTSMNFNEGCPTIWPGIGTTDVPCNATGVDTYGGASTENPAPVRGGEGTSYATVNGFTMTLTLDEPQTYFGLWWSAGNGANYLDFYSGDLLIGSFSSTSVIEALTSQTLSSSGGASYTVQDYFGNPIDESNSGEAYAYLHVFATSGKTFDKVVFSGDGFEFDNVMVAKGTNTVDEDLVHLAGPVDDVTPDPTPTPTDKLAETGGSDNSIPIGIISLFFLAVGVLTLRTARSKAFKS